jgi:hypothetical protein
MEIRGIWLKQGNERSKGTRRISKRREENERRLRGMAASKKANDYRSVDQLIDWLVANCTEE